MILAAVIGPIPAIWVNVVPLSETASTMRAWFAVSFASSRLTSSSRSRGELLADHVGVGGRADPPQDDGGLLRRK